MYYNKNMTRGFGGEFYGEDQYREGAFDEGFGEGTSFGYGGRSLEHHLYSSLMSRGKYAELDKAKHNEQYRNYLLENFEGDDDFPF